MNRNPAALGQTLAEVFGNDFRSLPAREKDLVARDFASLLDEEGGRAFPTWDHAAREYARRIGRGNLASYARCLVAATSR